ncbi:oligopeptide/dipeptide ABC transporter ATP-binding protein [Streptomyces sp. NPDC008137]|uniref:ABC transporter ATP-binding protein n=1 Tax=Streptomyces sp. NPDC008137 TaxID=3364813 RepID=UPI0036EEB941
MTEEQSPVLDVRNVSVGFRRRRREPLFQALDDVSLTVPRGTTMGLVGESGSGKSTLAKAVLGLAPAQSGSVHLLGQDTTHLRLAERRKLGSSMQAVFQDPNSSLNPSYTVGRSLAEPMLAQGIRSQETIARRTTKMLEDVGLDPAAAAKYPRDFSGGQRQRISIARALMTEPQLVICDESVSALDLSVKAQILNLLADLQDEHGVGYLFISHDMSVVRHICHDVTVLYRGQVMEAGPTRLVTQEPAHPYTRALLLAAPVADPAVQRKRRAIAAAGELANGDPQPGSGCPFAARCPVAQERCRQTRPEARTTADGRTVACHRYPEWQSEISTDIAR